MTHGLYISAWSSISPEKFTPRYSNISLDFVIIRARVSGRDDSKFTQHRKWAENQQVESGSLLWGADMFIGYAPGVNSGLKQAQDFWTLINVGGKTWEIPPEIDVEHQPKDYNSDGTVRSYWPLPSNFLENTLQPAVKYLQDRLGRSPMIYCSPRIIKEWFSENYTKEPPKWLLECPLHIAHYSVSQPSIRYWKTWYFWQKTNTVNWPGISAVCIEEFNGTRSDLKAWCRDPEWQQKSSQPKDPVEGSPQQPNNQDLSEVHAKLDQILAELEGLKWLKRS
ncbi:MAG: GH25 family lysozyme [Candidatus Methanomethylicaceae archaeon]